MTDPVQFFERRRTELEQLISAHLANGSLDEGNAAAFDALIDAWLDDELMQIAQAHDQEAATEAVEAQRRAASEAEAEAKRKTEEAERKAKKERERAVNLERQALLREEDHAHRVAIDARRERRADKVTAARRQLEATEQQLEDARRMLLGTAEHTTGEGALPRFSSDALTADRSGPTNGHTNRRVL